jgi:hypothetical protein
MTTLELFGLLARHASFPHPLRRSDLRACRYKNRSDLTFHREIFGAAIEQRRWDVAMDVAVALALNLPAMGRRMVSTKVRRLRAARELLPLPSSRSTIG